MPIQTQFPATFISQFNPPISLPGALVYADATDTFSGTSDGTAIGTATSGSLVWTNQGSAGNLNQSVNTLFKPTVQTVGGLKEVRFDGSDGLDTPAFAANCAKLVVALVARNTSGITKVLMEYTDQHNAAGVWDGFYLLRSSTTGFQAAHQGKTATGGTGSNSMTTTKYPQVADGTAAGDYHLMLMVFDRGMSFHETYIAIDGKGHGPHPVGGSNTDTDPAQAKFGANSVEFNVGCRNADNPTLGFVGGMRMVGVWNSDNWNDFGNQYIKLYNFLNTRWFSTLNSQANIVFNGDSRGYHYTPAGTTTGHDPLTQAVSGLSSRIIRHNFAVDGLDVGTMNSRAAAQADRFYANNAGVRNIAILWGGHNDSNQSAATIYSRIQTWYRARIAAGWTTIICTETPSMHALSITNGWEAKRLTINTNIRNDAATEGYTVADLAGNAAFDTDTDANDTTYYTTDKIHLNDTGADLVGSIIKSALSTIGVT